MDFEVEDTPTLITREQLEQRHSFVGEENQHGELGEEDYLDGERAISIELGDYVVVAPLNPLLRVEGSGEEYDGGYEFGDEDADAKFLLPATIL